MEIDLDKQFWLLVESSDPNSINVLKTSLFYDYFMVDFIEWPFQFIKEFKNEKFKRLVELFKDELCKIQNECLKEIKEFDCDPDEEPDFWARLFKHSVKYNNIEIKDFLQENFDINFKAVKYFLETRLLHEVEFNPERPEIDQELGQRDINLILNEMLIITKIENGLYSKHM